MSDGQIRTMIREIAGTHLDDKAMLFDAEVTSVNQNERTCEVDIISGRYGGTITAKLMSTVGDGVLLIPSTGSTVTVCMSNEKGAFIVQYSDIESIVFMGGAYQGMPIVIDPNDATKGLLAKINAIENLLNDLINNYNSHVHTGVQPGAGATGITSMVEMHTIATLTKQTDISHPEISI